MDVLDLIQMGFANLWRTRLRTSLTVLGVVIGIGALTSMVSFGSGLQKNVTDAFSSTDLFTSFTVTSKKTDPDALSSGSGDLAAGTGKQDEVLLTDSLLDRIRKIPGVGLAYANQDFPARIHLMGDSVSMTVTALPADIRKFRPYNDLLAGSFFSSDTSEAVVIREEALLSRLRIRLLREGADNLLSHGDSLKGVRLIHPDSLIGQSVRLVTMKVKQEEVMAGIMGALGGNPRLPFEEVSTELTIVGIMKADDPFAPGFLRGALIIPVSTAGKVPQLGFSNVFDLLNDRSTEETYGSIQVRLDDMGQMEEVRQAVESLGVAVFSFADQLDEIRRVFIVLQAALGVIGAIALLVAGLGITNTMVMSILERTREIGIMKAIGGSERQIQVIFFVEASVIGLIGAFAGILLGWAITRIANLVVNTHFLPPGEEPVSLFYYPPWLILGAIAFSLLVSLMAGLYPAFRASRIDPVKALRHD
ncbi:MAG: FtsX-like permease family protein [Bacteroidales bacterium]